MAFADPVLQLLYSQLGNRRGQLTVMLGRWRWRRFRTCAECTADPAVGERRRLPDPVPVGRVPPVSGCCAIRPARHGTARRRGHGAIDVGRAAFDAGGVTGPRVRRRCHGSRSRSQGAFQPN